MRDLRNLEVNIAEHCNLKCRGCDHSSPLMPARFVDADSIESWLRPLRGMRIGKLKLIGGEPLLHPEILPIIERVRGLDVADEIGVVTNGTLLHRQPDEFWAAVDFLQVTRYPGVRVRLSDEELELRAAAHAVRLTVVERNLFRHTVLDAPIEDDAVVRAIYQACELPRALGCHTLRDGRLFKCSPAAFLGDRLGMADHCADGLDLGAIDNVKAGIAAYLADGKPLRSCRYCLGTCGKDYPVSQQNAADLEAAAHRPQVPWRTLLNYDRLTAAEAP